MEKKNLNKAIPSLGLLLFLGTAGLAAGEEVIPYASHTFGSLEGKRQMTQDSERLYALTTRAGELRIYDKAAIRARMREVGKPPEPLGRLKLNGLPETLDWTHPTTLCIGTGHHLVLVDVANPSQPQILSEYPVARREIEGVSEVRVFGNSLFAAARHQGLLRFDVSDPRRLTPAGSIHLRGFSNSVERMGSVIVVATGIGLAFVDAEGPNLSLRSTVDTLRHTEIVRVLGGRLVACSKEYTSVFELTGPGRVEAASEVCTIDPFYFTHLFALTLTPDYIFAAGGEGGLYVYNWRLPRPPQLIIQYSFWGTKERFTEDRKTGYVMSLGLARNAREARRYISPNENNYIIATGMAVDGQHVYLMDFQDNLWALEWTAGPPPCARCVIRP